jgi:peroxiredoxin Q/BCP
MGRPKRAAAAAAEKALKADDTANKTSNKKSKSCLAVGDELPSFELQTDTEATLSSADMVQDNGIVLFCYPKANTGGCTTQAVGLSEKSAELAAAGFKVYGISADKPKAQANWKTKAAITCTLLCDPTHEVLHQLGFTKGAKSITRSHIVVSRGGKVLDVQYGVTPKNSIKEAVEFCLANKEDPLAAQTAADKGEEAAAAAPKEPKDADLEKEQDAASEPQAADEAEAAVGDEKDGEEEEAAAGADNDRDQPAADKAEGPAAMDVDGAAAAEAEAEAPREEQTEEKAVVEEAAANDAGEAAVGEGTGEEVKPNQATATAEKPAAEPAAEEQAAAGDEKVAGSAQAGEPAAKETAAEDETAPAAEDASKEAPPEAPAAAEAYAAAE